MYLVLRIYPLKKREDALSICGENLGLKVREESVHALWNVEERQFVWFPGLGTEEMKRWYNFVTEWAAGNSPAAKELLCPGYLLGTHMPNPL
jgi:hypothetical protein